jgi:hypothetical protein
LVLKNFSFINHSSTQIIFSSQQYCFFLNISLLSQSTEQLVRSSEERSPMARYFFMLYRGKWNKSFAFLRIFDIMFLHFGVTHCLLEKSGRNIFLGEEGEKSSFYFVLFWFRYFGHSREKSVCAYETNLRKYESLFSVCCLKIMKPSPYFFLWCKRNYYAHITRYLFQNINRPRKLISFSIHFPSDILPETAPPDFSFTEKNSRRFGSFFCNHKRIDFIERFLFFIPRVKVFRSHKLYHSL